MVKAYLKKRFTKSTMTIPVAEKFVDLFGSFQLLGRSKVIHSLSCYAKDNNLF